MLFCSAGFLPGALRACVAAGVRFAVVLPLETAPLSDDRSRLAYSDIIRAVTREAPPPGTPPMRVLGPGSFGFMRPRHGLNLTFSEMDSPPGKVAFLAHSGAMGTAIIDWCRGEGIGLSAFVSTGGMADVAWGDLLSYFGEDVETESIVISMETLGEARSFISAARETALTKPIIVLKAGRSRSAALRTAPSSSASAWSYAPPFLSGQPGIRPADAEAAQLLRAANEDSIIEAAFRRSSVLRVNTIAEMFYMAHLLAKQPRPRGGRLGIISNAVGPALLAADALVLSGGTLATPSEATANALCKAVPALPQPLPHPLDLGGGADGDCYRAALQLFAQDPNIDGILLIYARQPGADPAAIATALSQEQLPWGKPVLASWMGGPETETASDILVRARIPVFPYADTPARLFGYLWRFTLGIRALYETPAPTPQEFLTQNVRQQQAAAILQSALLQGRTQLARSEALALLQLYGIPATTETEASTFTTRPLGQTDSCTHQPTQLPLRLELVSDPEFGPVLVFGTGGPLSDVLQDTSVGLPPLTSTLARRMIERTRISSALRGECGFAPMDVTVLEEVLVRFSQLAVEQPRLERFAINPLVATLSSTVEGQPASLFLAAACHATLHPVTYTDAELPRPAIRPYPAQYAAPLHTKSGRTFLARPIRPDDEPAIVRFHSTLSEESVYSRYFHHIDLQQRVTHERLTRVCFNDYDREIAIVVEPLAGEEAPPRTAASAAPGESASAQAIAGLTGSGQIVAVGRLSRSLTCNDGEFAMLISDAWQSAGIGTALLLRLVEVARAEGLDHLLCDTFTENRAMQRVCIKAGFTLARDPDDHTVVRMTLRLR